MEYETDTAVDLRVLCAKVCDESWSLPRAEDP